MLGIENTHRAYVVRIILKVVKKKTKVCPLIQLEKLEKREHNR